jgi:hypothetical protein
VKDFYMALLALAPLLPMPFVPQSHSTNPITSLSLDFFSEIICYHRGKLWAKRPLLFDKILSIFYNYFSKNYKKLNFFNVFNKQKSRIIIFIA